mgnify:CR=1 FL=1
MDLIVKTQEKQVTITVKGYLKAITSDDREIKFYISGENNIMNASDELGKHHIWHNPCPTWGYHLSWILIQIIKQKFSSTYNKNHSLWKESQYLMLLR